jgi:hypothetical protein
MVMADMADIWQIDANCTFGIIESFGEMFGSFVSVWFWDGSGLLGLCLDPVIWGGGER